MSTPGPVETLARLSLQSQRYADDADYRDAVDAVLRHPVYDAAPALLAACELALSRLIRLDAEHLGPDPACEALRAAIRAVKGE